MEKHVVKRTYLDKKELYLDNHIGFCYERCNGGVGKFNSKSGAEKERRRIDKIYGIPKDVLKTEVMTYTEYLRQRDSKIYEMNTILKEKGYETHIEEHKLYAYASGMQFGKVVARWCDITLESIEYARNLDAKN